ncbi:cupredoxin domain-containing protein [Haloarcula amylovorans]|uniref:cupredoxin domain-containing protein n=1 Tax=Haloarcula amylovorans TaxID=2562280 RepID=UPI001ADD994F|nr:plastocyanin/azurin family copper-binding protein [Halomicroarcula amylolytica]
MSHESHTDDSERRTDSTTTRGDTDGAAEQPHAMPDVGRRAVLQALGIGASVAVGSGVVAADHDDPHPPRIDSHYGYATPDANAVPERLAPDHTVELHVGDPVPQEHGPLFHFEPTGLAVDPGDIVQFSVTTPDHTITAYHPAHGYQRRVPVDVPPFSSPVVSAGGAWLYRFEESGLYDLFCAPHHILGMAMRVVVGDLAEEDVPGYEDTFEGTEGPPPLLAPFSKQFLEHELERFSGGNEDCEWVWLTPQEVLDTDALDPGAIQADDGRVSFDEVLADIERIHGGHSHE